MGVRPRQKQEQKHNTYRPYRSQKRHRRAHLNFLQPLGSFLASLFFLGSCFLSASVLVQAQTPAEETAPTPLETTYDFTNISQCNLTTQELVALSNKDHVDPCIVFDIEPDRMHTIPYRTMTVTLVQVTPATSCRDARDGAVTSIEKLNQENDGRGIAIGFNKDYYIQFRLVSLIAGNADALGATQYGLQHSALLSAALEATKAQYIVGTCSFASSYEKQPALDYKTIVMAQVGPPGYYQDNNPYVFGAHINSDDYPIHTVRALGFRAAERNSTSRQPVRVIYRTQSEFFRSTCASAVVALKEFGFDNLIETSYDPDGDDDGDGDANAFDEDFLIKLADESCPPGSAEDPDFTPALFACVLSEQDILLERWRENGCRLSSIWLTAATWGWANDNPNVVPYMQGGGQWHPAFTYGDRFFQSGVHLLEYNEQQFGYYGTYDSVVSYAIPMIFAAHLENAYRVEDNPDPLTDFSSEEGYERLRRDLIMLNIDSIFGPVQFNEAQRNIGRGAAGTQWLPLNNDRSFRNALVSPFFQAEAEAVLPAASAQECNPGHYVNETLISSGSSLLQSKCSECPVDSYTAISNQQLQCNICPEGTSTGGLTGAKYCVKVNDNLLSKTILGFGYAAVCIVWVVSGCFMAWLYKHRNDPLVRISQVEFLFLICIGAIISSSTIIALSWQAGSSEHHRNGYNNDAAAASRACQAAPFLYTVGWGLMYGSLSAKSFRLHKVMSHPSMQRVTVTIWETLSFLFRILAIDLIIVIIWTTLYPLEVNLDWFVLLILGLSVVDYLLTH